MKLIQIASIILLFTSTFSLANKYCDDSKDLPERKLYFYNIKGEITQTEINDYSQHISKMTKYNTCSSKDLSIKAIILAYDSSDTSATDKVDFKKKLDPDTQLFTLRCTIMGKKILTNTMSDCINLIEEHIDIEKKTYTKDDLAQKQIEVDKSVISGLTDKLKLETPTTKNKIKKHLEELDFSSNSEVNILFDILDQRSTEIAIFRQRLKVLQRNSVKINQAIIERYGCPAVEDLEDSHLYYATCVDLWQLSLIIDKTLAISYDDTWFQNKNIETDIEDIENLILALEKQLSDKKIHIKDLYADNKNYIDHSSKYFSKYNNSGRFNIGLGVGFLKSPKLSITSSYQIDISNYSSTATSNITEVEQTLPDIQEPSIFIVAETPYVDIGLNILNDEETSLITLPVNQWKVNDDIAYLSQTQFNVNYKINYDLNVSFNLRNIWKVFSNRFWRKTYVEPIIPVQLEFMAGLGLTDIKITQDITTELRETITGTENFNEISDSQLDTITKQNNWKETLFHLSLAVKYKIADQVRFEVQYRHNLDNQIDDTLTLDQSTFSMNLSYLFF
jgi:hypothetical protein